MSSPISLIILIMMLFYRPDEGSVHPFQEDDLQSLFDVMKSWEEVFNSEMERFSGDVLLSHEDDLLKMTSSVDAWIGCAVKVYNMHPTHDGTVQQRSAMLKLSKKIEKLHYQFQLRMTGENGLANGYISFINALDTWYAITEDLFNTRQISNNWRKFYQEKVTIFIKLFRLRNFQIVMKLVISFGEFSLAHFSCSSLRTCLLKT